jgi:hypothetical protein
MEEETMDIQKPVKVFRDGAVAASVWLRQTSAGVFYDVTFSRSWKNEETDQWGYSQSFSDYHLDPLAELAQEAAMWIAEKKAHAETVRLDDEEDRVFSGIADTLCDDQRN